MLKPLPPKQAHEMIDKGDAIFVDIRSPDEHAAEKIAGARCLDMEDFAALKTSGKTIIFHCQSGMRTNQRSADLSSMVDCDAYVLEGGIHGWQNAGLPTEKKKGAVMPLQNQVLLTIGIMLLVFTGLSFTISPWFAVMIVAIAGGLIMAGLTGFCPLARFLMLMPWNRQQQACPVSK